jgi:hypothetical protein
VPHVLYKTRTNQIHFFGLRWGLNSVVRCMTWSEESREQDSQCSQSATFSFSILKIFQGLLFPMVLPEIFHYYCFHGHFLFIFWWDWGLNSVLHTCKVLYHLSHNSSPICSGYFENRILRTVSLGWFWTTVILISAFQVARIIDLSHWHLAIVIFLTLESALLRSCDELYRYVVFWQPPSLTYIIRTIYEREHINWSMCRPYY